MLTLEDVLKNPVIPRVEATDSLKKAARVIHEGGIGAALALDDQERINYLITKTDIVRAIAKGEDLEITTVEEYGTPSPLKLNGEKDLISALRLLKEYRISHVLVVHDNKLKGILYIRDIVFALTEFIPSGKLSLGNVSKRIPRLDEEATIADVATEIINMDTEAAFVSSKLVTDESVVRSAAYGDPYSDLALNYASQRIITTDPLTDLECAVRLMRTNNTDKLVVWKSKIASIKDIGYMLPDVVKELTRYILLVKDDDIQRLEGLQNVKVIKTIGKYSAIVIVEGEDALKNLSRRLGNKELVVLVELP